MLAKKKVCWLSAFTSVRTSNGIIKPQLKPGVILKKLKREMLFFFTLLGFSQNFHVLVCSGTHTKPSILGGVGGFM